LQKSFRPINETAALIRRNKLIVLRLLLLR